MRTPSKDRIAVVATLAITLALFGLAACSGKDSAATSTTAKAAAGPAKLTIAYQAIPNGDLVVKQEGWLEKALPGTTVEWKKFESGGDVNEAVTAGAVDIGLVGSSPTSRGLSSGIEYQVPWIHDVIGKAEALVVRSSKVNTIEDLKGKTVATPFASTSHYSLLAALKDAGVDPADVKIIDAEPDEIFAAWSRGDIDGAYIWNPNLAKLKDDGGKVLVDSEQLSKKGFTTYDLAVVTNKFAAANPGTVNIWAAQQNKAVELIKSDPAKAAKDIAAELKITPAEAQAQLGDLIFLTASQQVGADYLGGGLATNLYAAAQFNKDLGKIPAVAPKADYQKAVVPTFAKSAAG